jgi:hypothetical protein
MAMHCVHAQICCIHMWSVRTEPLVRTFTIEAMRPNAKSNTRILDASGKLGQTSTDFEVKQRKSAPMLGIDHSEPGKTAPDLASSSDIL